MMSSRRVRVSSLTETPTGRLCRCLLREPAPTPGQADRALPALVPLFASICCLAVRRYALLDAPQWRALGQPGCRSRNWSACARLECSRNIAVVVKRQPASQQSIQLVRMCDHFEINPWLSRAVDRPYSPALRHYRSQDHQIRHAFARTMACPGLQENAF
jgi:hypothetical protein